MEGIVVDSSILAASFLEKDKFHQDSQKYINGLETGDYCFHLPMLVVVELMAAISRQAQMNRLPLLVRAKKSIADWERDGKMVLYEMDRRRMHNALDAAEQYRLRGSDAIIAALADELDVTLKTFDGDVQTRFARASA